MTKSVRITPGENECEEEVFRFLQGSFFLDEPINAALKRMPKREDFRPLTYLKSGHSLAAYVRNDDGEDRLAGVVLNTVKRRGETVLQKKALTDEILFIMEKLEEETDVWSKVASEEMFYTAILSVGREFRGLKIGRKLIEESLKRATAGGFTHAVVECSSFYSSRIIESLKYEKIGEVRYDQIRNEKGEILVKPENPHEAIVKYLKKL